MRSTDSSITFSYKRNNILLIFKLELVKNIVIRIGLSGCEEFSLEAFRMRLRTCAKIHFLKLTFEKDDETYVSALLCK